VKRIYRFVIDSNEERFIGDATKKWKTILKENKMDK
jgi:hypothetical protein